MATKTEIQNLINENLADESNIIAEKHREVENKFLDEFFSPIIIDDNNSPVNIFQGLVSGAEYKIMTKKVGNIVTCQGFWKRHPESTLPLTAILKIVDPEYAPLSNILQTFLGSDNMYPTGPFSSNPLLFGIQPATNEIILLANNPTIAEYAKCFNFSYFTNG